VLFTLQKTKEAANVLGTSHIIIVGKVLDALVKASFLDDILKHFYLDVQFRVLVGTALGNSAVFVGALNHNFFLAVLIRHEIHMTKERLFQDSLAFPR
jgi:hypothetical protein